MSLVMLKTGLHSPAYADWVDQSRRTETAVIRHFQEFLMGFWRVTIPHADARPSSQKHISRGGWWRATCWNRRRPTDLTSVRTTCRGPSPLASGGHHSASAGTNVRQPARPVRPSYLHGRGRRRLLGIAPVVSVTCLREAPSLGWSDCSRRMAWAWVSVARSLACRELPRRRRPRRRRMLPLIQICHRGP
jgi:hypothetical protein